MKKKYRKIIVFILVSIVIMLTFTSIPSKNTKLSDDQLDQEQTESDGKDYIYSGNWKAQSFKPNAGILTRIQLHIAKIGNIDSDIEIIIKDTLIGQSLINYSISSSQIPYIEPDWVEFNFVDIQVVIDRTYYIICKTAEGDPSNSYTWSEASNNPYENGAKYFSEDNGIRWQQNPTYDFCFKTYCQKAELDIQYIKGGFGWNIYYGITNIGTIETKNIEVDITFSGGLILTGKTYTDIINQTIRPDEVLENTLYPVIGFGPTTITITVSSPEAPETSKSVQAFMFLFSIYVSPS